MAIHSPGEILRAGNWRNGENSGAAAHETISGKAQKLSPDGRLLGPPQPVAEQVQYDANHWLAGFSVSDWLLAWINAPGVTSRPARFNVRPHRGVRTKRYKYIHYFVAPEEFELYDLQTDPGERINLIGNPQYTQIQTQLAARLGELCKETGDRTRNVLT